MIYCFHMPVFVFLSGYFSKEINPQKLVGSCLIPFFIFNSIYAIFIEKSYNLLKPEYLYWYLLSLFFWRLLILPFKNKKQLLVVSLFMGLFVGYISDVDRFLSISRTICFFPFFIAGNLFTENSMKKLRKLPVWISIAAVAVCEALVVFLDRAKIMPEKMYELIEGYAKTLGKEAAMTVVPTSPLETGWILRLVIYAIGFIMTFSIISFTRETSEQSLFSNWGKRTLTILIFSGFAVKELFFLFSKIGIGYKDFTWTTQVILALPITVIMLVLCVNKVICGLYNKVMGLVNR